MPKYKPGHNPDEIEFAESKLAESRDRLKIFRDLQNSFLAGSIERALAARIIDEIEILHQVIEQLCHRLRRRLH